MALQEAEQRIQKASQTTAEVDAAVIDNNEKKWKYRTGKRDTNKLPKLYGSRVEKPQRCLPAKENENDTNDEQHSTAEG